MITKADLERIISPADAAEINRIRERMRFNNALWTALLLGGGTAIIVASLIWGRR